MNSSPSIQQYLISNCLLIIDEFNNQFGHIDSKEELSRIANEEFVEADLVFRIGIPFRHMAYYENKKEKKGNFPKTDIYVKEKDFRIEVKFLRNYPSDRKKMTGSANWEGLYEDFQWLISEIKDGKKHKSAFVMGWFNSIDYFSQIIQLGSVQPGSKRSGRYPFYDQNKVAYFPFLLKNGLRTKDLEISYDVAYKPGPVLLPDVRGHSLEYILIGTEKDKFNMVMYY